MTADAYRVASFTTTAPGDADGDGTDNLADLAAPGGNPLNPTRALTPAKGANAVADRAAFDELSYRFDEVLGGKTFRDQEIVKFWVLGPTPPTRASSS